MMQVPPALDAVRAVIRQCHVADVRFFKRRPERRHRVRLAAPAELALARRVAGITAPVPAGIRAFVAIERGATGRCHYVLGFRPEMTDTDVAEPEAAEAYRALLVHDDATLRALAGKARQGGAAA
jgi:hypothetical protein